MGTGCCCHLLSLAFIISKVLYRRDTVLYGSPRSSIPMLPLLINKPSCAFSLYPCLVIRQGLERRGGKRLHIVDYLATDTSISRLLPY